MTELSLPHTVFVYGTLKKGERNEHVMTNPETGKHIFISAAQMVERYPLIVASKYNIPFLLNRKGEGFVNFIIQHSLIISFQRVYGELYQVDDSKLAALDVLEGYPEFYTREIHEFETKDGRIIKAWIYILRKYDPRLEEGRTDFIQSYTDGIEGKFYNTQYVYAFSL